MTKEMFLNSLAKKLSRLPKREIEECLAFYGEMIDDRMEEGLSEEEAVAGIGTVDGVISQIVAEIPLSKLVKQRMKRPKEMDTGLVLLLILGFPIWLPLLIASFAVVFSLYASLWAVIVSLWAVVVALAACAVVGVILFIVFLCIGKGVTALAVLGAGIVCAGLAILLSIGCVYVTKGGVLLGKKVVEWLKKAFIKKERNDG